MIITEDALSEKARRCCGTRLSIVLGRVTLTSLTETEFERSTLFIFVDIGTDDPVEATIAFVRHLELLAQSCGAWARRSTPEI